MEADVGASAAGWAAVAAGIVALVALILLWRTRAELRKMRRARSRENAGQWQAPITSSGSSQDDRGSQGEPAANFGATGPTHDATSIPETATETVPETPSELTASDGEPPLVHDEAAEEAQSLEVLLELVEDEEPDTRRDAVIALAGARGPGGAEPLTLILGRDPSAEVRREAVAALRGSLERHRDGSSDADT